jgi:DNA-binding response OmpR family regulator
VNASERSLSPPDPRPILVIADDLFVRSRIDATARATGQSVRYARSADDFRAAVRADQPATVLVGLAATRLPWAALVRELRADPATAGTYVLAFGPHKNLGLRAEALDAGVDRVLANSAFTRALPTLLAAPSADVDDEEDEA